ncbi:MAG: DNA polymerase III subunit gamma/tau [Acidobacteria bacterium]|nr:DNA polymerase III subunit gamma/tau [Acidobacteriota bacterium]
MSYLVIARKWRPQKFDDVVGQQAVTRTLRNALSSGRLAQAFVFAGPRGVGKTTTARILARALSCVKGPTPDPCGVCEPCVEIAEGRDMDVLEIDAATHTGIDNVRDVIITGLSIMPVRDRYKIFIIDEVHQLSPQSFNALLKSIEEPPPHVVFMMATTELEKIPETVLSRSQVYEFRTISTKAIADQLRTIVDAEGITAPQESLQLIARDAEGSMRDAQSKLDQVIAFTGKTMSGEDVATVLGLVGRDLLLDAVQAVADEDAPAAFTLAARAVELGYDLRAVCRELSRVVRDLLVLTVDPSRLSDPEIAGETERDRLKDLAGRFSREDLLRAFDVLTKAEVDIRASAQPRYHLEMALLRWIYLRKLVSIEDLIAGAPASASAPASRATVAARPTPVSPSTPATKPILSSPSTPSITSTALPRSTPASASTPAAPSTPSPASNPAGGFKDALLSEIRKAKGVFYNMVVAQAQKIEVAGDQMTFTFSPAQRALREQLEQNRAWLESLAQAAAGRKIAIVGVQQDAAAGGPQPSEGAQKAADKKNALREQALADSGVQAMLEVFPAEIRDVEEI